MISPENPPADPFDDDLSEGKVFRDLDFRGGEISDKIFRECTFTNVTFAEARLRECRFEDCVVRLSDWPTQAPAAYEVVLAAATVAGTADFRHAPARVRTHGPLLEHSVHLKSGTMFLGHEGTRRSAAHRELPEEDSTGGSDTRIGGSEPRARHHVCGMQPRSREPRFHSRFYDY
jgi:hypothetical protein